MRKLTEAQKNAFYKGGFDNSRRKDKTCYKLTGSQFDVFESELLESKNLHKANIIPSIKFSQIENKIASLRLAKELNYLNYDCEH